MILTRIKFMIWLLFYFCVNGEMRHEFHCSKAEAD